MFLLKIDDSLDWKTGRYQSNLSKLLLIHSSVLMFEFSFHSHVQNQKLIIYLMFFFPLILGKLYV